MDHFRRDNMGNELSLDLIQYWQLQLLAIEEIMRYGHKSLLARLNASRGPLQAQKHYATNNLQLYCLRM